MRPSGTSHPSENSNYTDQCYIGDEDGILANIADPEAHCVGGIESQLCSAGVHPVPADDKSAGEGETSVAGEGG